MKLNKETGKKILPLLVIVLGAIVLAYPTQVQLFFGGFTGAIIGTPFLSEEIADREFPLNCANTNCIDPITRVYEGTYGLFGVSVVHFAETDLGADFDVRAVTCSAKVSISAGHTIGEEPGGNLVSQIQTKDGKWIDYYHSAFPVSLNNQQTLPPAQFLNAKKVDSKYTDEDLWIWMPVSNEIMQIEDGQRFITSKVRCSMYRNAGTYNRTITLTDITLKIYGTAVVPTCFDGIKNQDEEEIDCGGICNSCGLIGPVVVCGDGICSENETEANCPADCSTIIFEPEPIEPVDPTIVECLEGEHKEVIEGQEVCITNIEPTNLSPTGIYIPIIIGIIILLGIGIVYMVFFRKQ